MDLLDRSQTVNHCMVRASDPAVQAGYWTKYVGRVEAGGGRRIVKMTLSSLRIDSEGQAARSCWLFGTNSMTIRPFPFEWRWHTTRLMRGTAIACVRASWKTLQIQSSPSCGTSSRMSSEIWTRLPSELSRDGANSTARSISSSVQVSDLGNCPILVTRLRLSTMTYVFDESSYTSKTRYTK